MNQCFSESIISPHFSATQFLPDRINSAEPSAQQITRPDEWGRTVFEPLKDRHFPNRIRGRPVAGDEKTRRRFVLTAAFVQGIPLCQQAVLSALYLQAGNLLRQEFECLAL